MAFLPPSIQTLNKCSWYLFYKQPLRILLNSRFKKYLGLKIYVQNLQQIPLSEFFFSKVAALNLVTTVKNILLYMYFSRIWNIDVEAHNFQNIFQLVACCFLHLVVFGKTGTSLKKWAFVLRTLTFFKWSKNPLSLKCVLFYSSQSLPLFSRFELETP